MELVVGGVTEAGSPWFWAGAEMQQQAMVRMSVVVRVVMLWLREWGETGIMMLLIRRAGQLTDVRDVASIVLSCRTLTGGWTTHAIANSVTNLGSVHVELCEGAAQRVAVHAKFVGCLALITLVVREHFEDIALLEFANGIRVRNACTVHLRDKDDKFALQDCLAGRPLIWAASSL